MMIMGTTMPEQQRSSPLYILGFMGMTRRLNHYDNPAWHPYLVVAAIGAFIILGGILCQFIQLYVSIRDRKDNMDVTGDPWNARTLEWSISSPPPFYNFAHMPNVEDLDAHWDNKEKGIAYKRPASFEKIHMPKNAAAGVIIGLFSVGLGFGLIWYIWWMVILSAAGILATMIVRAFNEDVDYYVQVDEVARIENAHHDVLEKNASSHPFVTQV